MIYYHTPTVTEYDDRSVFANKLTRCGEPWKLDLTEYDSVPVVKAELGANQKHGTPILEDTRYYYPAIDKTAEELTVEKQNEALSTLTESDSGTIRVLEDLVELLCTKNHIQFTELPQAAQDKLNNRKQQRMILAASDGVTAQEEAQYSGQSMWTTIKSWFGF